MKRFVVTVVAVLFLCAAVRGFLLCSKQFCDDYTAEEPCGKLPEACGIQNSTHNGLELPSAMPCNCCEYCLENLDEGDTCALGDPSSPMPTTICGNELSCSSVQGAPTCQKIVDTACTKAQVEYDKKRENGELGHLEMRPECDRNGLYKPYKCVPGENCFCVSEDGQRIFGDIPATATPEYILRCQCSRNYHKAAEIRNRNLHPNEHLRCQSNGDYDTIQCFDNNCLCADAEDGHPTYPERAVVNITSISATSLPCFNNVSHMEAEYYRDCEALYIDQLKFIKEYEAEGLEVMGFTLPSCQLDGYYAPVQENTTMTYCSDPHGRLLENYAVANSDPLTVNMDCKCARARSVMVEDEKPECCRNGNYKEVQCRRGQCHCVDENGIQTAKEVDYPDKETLPCTRPRINQLCD